MLSDANLRRIKRFIDAHPQHEVKVRIQSHSKVRVELEFHNGENWMGTRRDSTIKTVNETIRDMMKEARELRPDLFRNLR